jgi:hypothetical protein
MSLNEQSLLQAPSGTQQAPIVDENAPACDDDHLESQQYICSVLANPSQSEYAPARDDVDILIA